MMMLEPLGERVLVQVLPVEEVSTGGVILPQNAIDKPNQGTVEAIGHGVPSDNPIKVGDRIIFSQYAGMEVKFEGCSYRVMNLGEVFGILRTRLEELPSEHDPLPHPEPPEDFVRKNVKDGPAKGDSGINWERHRKAGEEARERAKHL